jgi:hypothetical protein
MIRLSVCIFIFIFNLLQYFSEVTYILNFVSSGTYKLFYWCKKGTLIHSPLSLKLGLQARPRPNIYIYLIPTLWIWYSINCGYPAIDDILLWFLYSNMQFNKTIWSDIKEEFWISERWNQIDIRTLRSSCRQSGNIYMHPLFDMVHPLDALAPG